MLPYYHSISPVELTGEDLDNFLALGWYRMHQSIFTSSHVELDQVYRVHWLRYMVSEIKSRSSHRKIRKRNNSFLFTIEDFTGVRSDHNELHARYRSMIDFNGALSIQECLYGDNEVTSTIYNTKCISVFDQDKLIAGGYFDVGNLSGTSILHFFDPDYYRNSLGKYLILITTDYLKQMGYHLYYPGYVVEGQSKMNYKLFLGKEDAQYFDPETVSWKYFDESILIKPQSSSYN